MTKENFCIYLTRIIKVGVFFVLLLPLVVGSKFFFPYIVVKYVFFRVLVEFIFAAYLILVLLDKKYRPQKNHLVSAVIGFLGVSFIAAILGNSFYQSFWGTYERMAGLYHLFHLVLYFIVLVNVFRSKEDWHSFFTFSVFVSTLMCFFALAQWLQAPFLIQSSGGSRLAGTVGNAAFFAPYLLFNLFFCIYFLAKEKRFAIKLYAISFLVLDIILVISGILDKYLKADLGKFEFLKYPLATEIIKNISHQQTIKFVVITLIFQAIILFGWLWRSKSNIVRVVLSVVLFFLFFIFFNTQTRGAMIGLAASLFLLSLSVIFFSQSRQLKRVNYFCLAVLIISVVSLFIFRDNPNLRKISTLNRLANISFNDITTESRLLTWGASWRGLTESTKTFLIGVGPENYYYVFNKYFPAKIYKDSGSQIWFDRAHDIVFDVSVTTGVIGFITYLSIFLIAAWFLIKVYRKSKVISSSFLIIGLLVAYFIQNIFVFDTLNTDLLFYLVLGFIALTGFQAIQNSASADKEPEKFWQAIDLNYEKIKYFYFAAIAAFIIFGSYINYRTLEANNYIYKAIVAQDYELSYQYFRKAIDLALAGKFEARQQYSNLGFAVVRNEKMLPERKIEIVQDIAKELEKSVAEEPLNVRHYLWLASFYDQMAQVDGSFVDSSIEVLNKGIALSPDRPQLYFELGQAYLLKNQVEKGLEYFQLGVEKAPWVIESHLKLISLATLLGNDKVLNTEFERLDELNWQPNITNFNQFVTLALRVKNYFLAQQFQQRVIMLEPDVTTHYFDMAIIYAKAGDEKNAKEYSKKGLDLDPAAKEQYDQFIELLEKGELKDK